ncbi:mucin-19 isoform X9 [Drosophila eugracilis]|uniref:mucin-19 isoform X9 n=1 Tax=Drosophila eugracilis TaxID=29029 RepID=UPI001BD9B5EF|nr:mucin-19 isoform X9 [Drosophila eugracilis]
MEVIKPMDFSSFSAFCEHLNKSSQIATAIPTTLNNGNDTFLEKMERQGKMELAAKEREAQRLQLLPKKWNRREEYEFLRVLTGYGVDLHLSTPMNSSSPSSLSPDWTKFKQMAHLERKSDETLTDYYKVFLAMCKRQAGLKLTESERGLEGIIEEIEKEHAKLILDRLEVLAKLREVARNPLLEERLKLCTKNADTPDWWEPGRHDKELITAVLKHGLYRSETFIFNDPNFSFGESEKRFIRELEAQIQRTIKLEAFNAEKAEKLAAAEKAAAAEKTTAEKDASIRNEVIDLDEELMTDESVIKKETPETEVKDEIKTEENTEKIETAGSHEINKSEEKDSTKMEAEVKEEGDLKAETPENDATDEIRDCDKDKTLTENLVPVVEENKPIEDKMEINEPAIAENGQKDTSPEKSTESNEKKSSEESSSPECAGGEESKMEVDEDASKAESKSSEDPELTEKESEDKAVKGEEKKDSKEESKEQTEDREMEKKSVVETDPSEEPPIATETETNVSKKPSGDQEILDLGAGPSDPDDDEVMKEKEKAVEEECKKQAAELKARFPDLEVIQPATVKQQKLEKPKLEMCMIRWFKDFALERRIAHIVACVESGKWPVDSKYSAFASCKGTTDLSIALHESIPHLSSLDRRSTTPDVITITTDQGVTKHLQSSHIQQVASSASSSSGMPQVTQSKPSSANSLPGLDAKSINAAVAAAVAAAAAGGNATSLSSLLPGMSLSAATGSSAGGVSGLNVPSTVSGVGKKRKRHIAIDVETERAKLHALLNSSTMAPKDWESEIANMEALTGSSGRGRGGSSSALTGMQPPPAHQHASLSRQSSGQFSKPAVPALKTPPPSMGAPMDLSSSLPKMNMTEMLKSASSAGAIDLSEVQDFSMPSKKSSVHAALSSAFPSMGSKSKLDDTLNKLMKKNNCTIEEPVIGKEKKRKKLDEIVLGLSAAKEQKTFPDPSLPSSKKPQIPPSVSVTPANLQSSTSQQSNQKPFTITVTTVPGKSKGGSTSGGSGTGGSSSASGGGAGGSGLSALQNMAMGGLSSKDSLNALLAQTMATDPQTFLKQQQKMMQFLPPAQRKAYENMLAEMEQAMKISSKFSTNSPHDVKVNKWLSDMTSPLGDQLSIDYVSGAGAGGSGSANSRRSNRQQSNSSQQSSNATQMQKQQQQQQQQQHSMSGPQNLTGEEPVPVINKQTGKRLGGNKAPQLKRLMQWLTENPNYEVDPKWLEQMQNPMSAPSPKPTSIDSSYGSSAVKSHGGRPSSNSSNTSSSSHTQQQQQSSSTQSSAGGNPGSSKKSSRQQTAASAALDQAALQFGSLAGLNPSLLANLPGLGAFDPKNPLAAFDPKNPLLSMSFGGMPGMGNIPGLSNLNNMNLFASLAGMGGLGNLAGMDTQSLAALMAAAGPTLGGLTGASGGVGSGKSQAQSGGGSSAASSSSSASKKKQQQQQQQAQNEAAQLAAAISASTGGSSGGAGSKNAAASASQLAAGFPFLFPNPSLLYPPMGLGGLNPYSLGTSGLGSAYDQLAQQYNLLNGATSSASNTSSTQSKSHQSQSKSSQARNATASANSAASLMNAMASMGGGTNTVTTPSSSASGSGRGRQSSNRNQPQTTPTAADMAQLSSLLMPGADPHLLESLSRMSNMDLAQATRLMSSLGMPPLPGTPSSSGGGNSSSSKRNSQAANEANAQAKEQQKWFESLTRGALPADLAALQAFSQGKMPSTSGSSAGTSTSSSKSSKAAAAAAAAALPQIPGMSSDFSQAFLAEMAAQAMAAAGGSLPLSGPGSLASLAGLTGGSAGGAGGSSSASGSGSHSSSKRQREQDAFKQQMDYYTKTLGLGSGISLIPTSSAGGSSTSSSSANAAAAAYAAALDAEQQHQQQQKALSKRLRGDIHPTKEELAAAALAAGLPLNLGASMSSIEKSLRGGSSSSSSSTPAPMPSEQDKVTLTPLNASGGGSGSSSSSAAAAGLAANLPSQTTITIAPPISSGASTSSERSERSESRISLTITNAADAAKLPPPYEEADELIIQPILKKPTANPGSSHGGSVDDLDTAENTSAANLSGSSSSSAAAAAAAAVAEENRRSSNRLKRPRSGNEQGSSSVEGQPPEKRRELRSTRHTRSSADASTLNLSTGSESGAEDRNE